MFKHGEISREKRTPWALELVNDNMPRDELSKRCSTTL